VTLGNIMLLLLLLLLLVVDCRRPANRTQDQ